MSRVRLMGAVLILSLAAIALASCSERTAAPPPADGAVTEVVITNFAFTAPAITIDRGTSIRWRNSTSTFHTVTPDGHQSFVERQTNTQGQTFESRFDQPGTYRYYCAPHRGLGMTGEIVVR